MSGCEFVYRVYNAQMHQVPRYDHVTCGGCRTRLMFPSNASSVRCSLCNFITSAPRGGGASLAGSSGAGGSGGQPSQAAPSPHLLTTLPGLQGGDGAAAMSHQASMGLEVVMIENPSTYDKSGHEMQNLMVGIKVAR